MSLFNRVFEHYMWSQRKSIARHFSSCNAIDLKASLMVHNITLYTDICVRSANGKRDDPGIAASHFIQIFDNKIIACYSSKFTCKKIEVIICPSLKNDDRLEFTLHYAYHFIIKGHENRSNSNVQMTSPHLPDQSQSNLIPNLNTQSLYRMTKIFCIKY